MKKLFLAFLLLSSISAWATDHVVGSGSGTLSITSMSGVANGDRFVVTHGTYTSATIANIHDVTIINDNAGSVTFTGQVNFGNGGDSIYNVTWSGNGYSGAAYGFISTYSQNNITFTNKHDRQCRFYYWSMVGGGNADACFDFSHSGSSQTTYVGTTATLKEYQLTISHCNFLNCTIGVKGSYAVNPIDNTQIIDSFDFSYNIITQVMSDGNFVDGVWSHVNFHHNNISNVGTNSGTTDVGFFFIEGSGQVHHNYKHGGRGYMARVWGMSLRSAPIATWLYDNIDLATQTYSEFDCNSDSTYHHIAGNYWGPTFIHMVNNTAGNKNANNNYEAVVSTFENFNEGATIECRNNLGFNTFTPVGNPNHMFRDFVGVLNSGDTSNNQYYTAGTVLNFLVDTSATCLPKTGAPIVGAGLHFANITTDQADSLWLNPPSIGAREVLGSVPLTPPSLTAAAGASVDNPFAITFTPTPAYNSAVTSVTVNGTALPGAAYSFGSGTLTLTPSASALLQVNGSPVIVIFATGYNSNSVTQPIAVGAPNKLSMNRQPTAPATNGSVLATQPKVNVQDQYANFIATATNTIVATVGAGTWTISGTTSVAASSGTTTFTNLAATSAALVSGATVIFTSAGLTSVTSNAFNIPAPPSVNCNCLQGFSAVKKD